MLCSQSEDAAQQQFRLRDTGLVAEYQHFGPLFTLQDFDIDVVAARLFPQLKGTEPLTPIKYDSPIDFIFVTDDIRVLSYGIIADHPIGKLPSDHYPIIADMLL